MSGQRIFETGAVYGACALGTGAFLGVSPIVLLFGGLHIAGLTLALVIGTRRLG